MNKKITVKNGDGQIRYCILSGEADLERQFNKWYFGKEYPDGGYAVRFLGDTIKVVDYYVNETRATFEVLSIEDTEADTVEAWVDPETLTTGWA